MFLFLSYFTKPKRKPVNGALLFYQVCFICGFDQILLVPGPGFGIQTWLTEFHLILTLNVHYKSLWIIHGNTNNTCPLGSAAILVFVDLTRAEPLSGEHHSVVKTSFPETRLCLRPDPLKNKTMSGPDRVKTKTNAWHTEIDTVQS